MIGWFRRVFRRERSQCDHDALLHGLRAQAQVAELERHLIEQARKRDVAEALRAAAPPRLPWNREHQA